MGGGGGSSGAPASIDLADVAILATIALLTAAFVYWRSAGAGGGFGGHDGAATAAGGTAKSSTTASSGSKSATNTRTSSKKSLSEKVRSIGSGNRLVAFFGSQTGTAEDLATRTAREVSSSLGINTAVCDLEEYDMAEITSWSTSGDETNILLLFFLATYGEGEPTDNAVDFYSWLMDGKGLGEDEGDEDDEMSFSRPLEGLPFLVFGLGNKTYEHYNAIGRRVDRRFEKLGAARIMPCGEGDDDASLEEDFLGWKPKAVAAIATHFNLTAADPANARKRPHAPSYTIAFPSLDGQNHSAVFRGEFSAERPRSWTPRGPELPEGYEVLANNQLYDECNPSVSFGIKHPFYSRIVKIHPLFTNASDSFDFASSAPGAVMPVVPAGSPLQSALWSVSGTSVTIPRQCYHVEFDLTGSGLTYTTGDHLGVWPENNPDEVARLAAALGVTADLDRVVSLEPNLDNSMNGAKKPFPTPCTLRAALTSYLDLTDVLKQFHLEVLAKYAQNASDREQLFRLSEDRALYTPIVEKGRKNLADVLQDFKSVKVPLGVVLGEILPHTSVRYYSISSSSKEDPNKVSATAVVVRYAVLSPVPTPDALVAKKTRVVVKEGMATTWLERQHMMRGQPSIVSEDVHTKKSVPLLHAPLYIRPSNFHLPEDATRPVVMVGPGTGVAPFRAFVRERVLSARQGNGATSVGPTWLFYGCRTRASDYLYRTEFEALEAEVATQNLPIDLRIVTAFSRETSKKVYVQHRILEHKTDLWRLLDASQGNGVFYICGDAKHMASDVARALETVAMQAGGLSEDDAKQWLRSLKSGGRFFEDVWG